MWRERKRIREFSEVRRGASPRPIDDPIYFGGNVGWVRISDVSKSKRYLKQTQQYLSPLGEANSVRVYPGDIIMSICGTVGSPIIIDMHACIHDGFVHFNRVKETNLKYLYYLLENCTSELRNMGQSGTQMNLNTSLVGSLEVFHPRPPEQEKIALILSTIDEAIEKTEDLIAKYEQMKQGIMQDLFTRGVDKNGKLRPTYSEAPHLYKPSPLGPVPKEWNVERFSPRIEISYGKSQKLIVSEYGNIPVYGTGGLIEFATKSMFDKDSILIGRKGTIDSPYYIKAPFWVTDTAYYVSNFLNGSIKWLSYKLTTINLKNLNEATGVPSLNRETIYRQQIAFPEFDEQEIISQKIEAIDKKITTEKSYLAKLCQEKAGLMQDLLTGKVRVKLDSAKQEAA